MTYLTTPEGVRLRYSDRGVDGAAVVLVHGWKGSLRLWDRVVIELQDRHRVISFDLRGMGESDKPRCAYNFDEFASDLGVILEALEVEAATVVGWSMGCTVSLRYLERGGARVERLVLLNGPLRLTNTHDFQHAMTEDQLESVLADLTDRWPGSERAFQAATVLGDKPELVDLLYDVALQTPLDVALAAVRQQMRLDMRGVLKTLPVPVLAAFSRRDPYYPVSLAEFIATEAPSGAMEVFENSGHATPLEEPRRLAAVISRFCDTSDEAAEQ